MSTNNPLINLVYGSIGNFISENITWKYMDEKNNHTCSICNIPIIKGDMVSIIDCTCLYHYICLMRYSARVANKCPTCNVPISDKIEEIKNNADLILSKLKTV